MPLHFSDAEFGQRRAAVVAGMRERGLDGLLLFRQESQYWLTGYDTFGYVFFQCVVVTADGRMALLTRAPDQRQAHFTSTIKDVRVWVDREGSAPTDDLIPVLRDLGLDGSRIGVEWNAYGLPAALGFALVQSLDGVVTTEDASDLISRLRVVKSAAELTYVRKAMALADDAYRAACAEVRPGAYEGDILAALQGAIYRGGGDDPANEQIIGSGPGALMCRYFTGRRHLDAEDQLTLEFAAAYRHYHSARMHTLRVGAMPDRQRFMMDAAEDAFAAAHQALTPGRPIGEVFDAHARVLDAAGLAAHRLNACGYSLGTTFAPNWMDWPMLYRGNTVPAAQGMVFFIHIIIFDSSAGLAATLGRTVIV